MKNTFKQNYYIIGTVSILLFLSFIFGFAYNQNRVILADEKEEEIEYERLKCGREIPVGEAMEKTGELLEAIARELERIETNSYYLIETQKEMEELAKKCSMENCTPKCRTGCIGLSECQGDPCPDREKITELFDNITDFNNEIQGAKDKIYKLIYESVEPLCIKENEDIRTTWEKTACITNPFCWEWTLERILSLEFLPDWLVPCPRITVQRAIERKLALSRGEFDKCYISPEDIEKVFLGEKTGKYLFSCPIVSKEDYPRYTKTTEKVNDKEIPVCTSPYNWFCCTNTPQ